MALCGSAQTGRACLGSSLEADGLRLTSIWPERAVPEHAPWSSMTMVSFGSRPWKDSFAVGVSDISFVLKMSEYSVALRRTTASIVFKSMLGGGYGLPAVEGWPASMVRNVRVTPLATDSSTTLQPIWQSDRTRQSGLAIGEASASPACNFPGNGRISSTSAQTTG